MNYGEVLSNAWKIIWKYKVLWIFGILAGLGSGGGSSGNGGSGNRFNFTNGSNPGNFNFPNYSDRVLPWLENNWWLIAVLILLAILVVIAVIILGTYGRIGLTRGAWQADDGAARLTFGGLFAESGRYFWRVLLLAILIFAVSLLLVILIALPSTLLAVATLGIGLICLIPFFCILGIIGWVAQIIIRLAIISIVGEDLGVMAGLQRGWEIVRAHLAETLVMGLILGIGGGVVNFLIALPFLGALLPLGMMIFDQTSQVVRTSMITAGVLFCLYLPVAIFLGGVVESYVGTAWTLTFRRLSGRARVSDAVVSI